MLELLVLEVSDELELVLLVLEVELVLLVLEVELVL